MEEEIKFVEDLGFDFLETEDFIINLIGDNLKKIKHKKTNIVIYTYKIPTIDKLYQELLKIILSELK